MFTSLDVFKIASAMAAHSGQRQALVAENIAHADTPGYRARDLPAFSESYRTTGAGAGLKATRAQHLFGQGTDLQTRARDIEASASANGNTVTLEEQMLRAVEIKRHHDRAIAIYRSSMGILRTSLGRQA